jgi:hypothetical protein
MLPRVPAPVVSPGLASLLRWAPVLPRGPVPVDSWIRLLAEAGSRAAAWLHDSDNHRGSSTCLVGFGADMWHHTRAISRTRFPTEAGSSAEVWPQNHQLSKLIHLTCSHTHYYRIVYNID